MTAESIFAGEVKYELEIIKTFANKGVIINIPDILDFPFFHFYPYHNLSNLYSEYKIYSHFYNINTTVITPNALFLPTENTNLLFRRLSDKGLSFKNPLDDGDVLTDEELIRPDKYNKILEKIAKSNNLPIVDLYSLYKKILSGEYVSEDGFIINPNYENGNFFSTDGLTPTAIGQAIIANEIIKVVNSHYKAKIPRIDLLELNKNYYKN